MTTTPLQALALLNNSFVLRMADAFADEATRATHDGGEGAAPERAAREMFKRAYGREPLEQERTACGAFAARHGLAALARVLLNANAFVYVE